MHVAGSCSLIRRAHRSRRLASLAAPEQDAVSPGRHPALLAAVIVQGLLRVLVKLVGGPEGDGGLLQVHKGAPCRHLQLQLVLHMCSTAEQHILLMLA